MIDYKIICFLFKMKYFNRHAKFEHACGWIMDEWFFFVFSFYQINQIIEYKLKTNNTGTIENTVYVLYKCLHLGSKNSKAIIRIYFVIWPYWPVICRPVCSKKKKIPLAPLWIWCNRYKICTTFNNTYNLYLKLFLL